MSSKLEKSIQNVIQVKGTQVSSGVLNIQTPIRITPFILHILILSWIKPNQEQNTTP